jgi:hypothetical protein
MNFRLAGFVLILFAFASVSIFAQSHGSGGLSGKLLRSNGKPLPYTELELVPVDSAKIVVDSHLIAISYPNGNFAFTNIPAGKYTLSINFDDKPTDLSPYETFFYPDATERSKAQVFDIKDGVKFTGLIFRLPAPLAQIKIGGNAVFTNGKPVVGAFIAMRDVDYDAAVPYGIAKTDKNGNFSVVAFENRVYQLGAILFEKETKTISEAYGLTVIAGGESKVFTVGADTPVIKIEVKTTEDIYRIKEKYLGMIGFKDREAL